MIKLIAETHTYVNDLAPKCKYTSVTTVLGNYKEKFDEDYHAERVALRKGLTKDQVIAEWREINRQANEYGTNLHEILERFLLAPKRMYSPRDEFERIAINAFRMVCDEEGLGLLNSDTIRPEHIMSIEFTEEKGIAGTADIIEDIPKNMFNVWDFKGLDINTDIPTKDGFKKMGEIVVGDKIFDGNGDLTEVQHISEIHYNPCYKILFDTNETLICDHEHKWVISKRLSKNKYRDVEYTTEELYSLINKKEKRNNPIRIKNVALSINEDIELPIDPYVLGCWLGDGSKSCGIITNMNQKIWDEIRNRGYNIGDDISKGSSGLAEFKTIYGIRGKLNKLGILNNKDIPDIYLRSSHRQRLDLLRGFMDTDGYYNKKGDRCVMITTNDWQAEKLAELVNSLGWKATIINAKTTGFDKINIKTKHVCFKPISESPFLCKTEDYLKICKKDTEKSKYRYIKDIKLVETIPTKCLSVISDTHCYLATRNYIKTHNTNKKFEFENKYGEFLHFPVNHLPHCQYNDYTLQLSIYGVMYERETGRKFNRGGLFYWDKYSQTFRLIPICYMKREAEMVIEHFKLKLL